MCSVDNVCNANVISAKTRCVVAYAFALFELAGFTFQYHLCRVVVHSFIFESKGASCRLCNRWNTLM